MSRTENPYMKQYLEEFVVDRLSKCKLFVDTFGKDFAKKRLVLNLDKVYTNEKNQTASGYYRGGDLSITICRTGKDENLLVPEDLSEDDKETVLHESVHAIFAKTKKECKDDRIQYGTGVMSRFSNGGEIGRGLNEGLTEWICEKAGFENKTYITLTNFVKQIELALGEKQVMKFARACDYEVTINTRYGRQNLAELLDMDKLELFSYLAIADEVYKSEDNIRKIDVIISALKRNEKRDELSENEIKKLDEDLSLISKETMYMYFEDNSEYYTFLQDNDLENIDSSKIKYLETIREKDKKSLAKSRIEFDSITFEKYFSKEFEDFKQMEEIPEKDFEKFYKLQKFMKSSDEYAEEFEDSSSIKFIEEFKEVQKRYKEQVSKELENYIKSKSLTSEILKKYCVLFKMTSFAGGYNDLLKVLESSDIEYPEATLKLLMRLEEKENLSEASKYEIVAFGSKDNDDENIIYFKDGVPDKDMVYTYGSFSEQDDVDYNEVFDFTLELDEDINSIIHNFLDLKNKIVSDNPNAKFTILNREIVVNTEDGNSYYRISKGEISEIEEIGRESIDFFSKSLDDKKAQLPIPERKESFLKKMIVSIKRKLFANKKDTTNYFSENNVENMNKKGDIQSQSSFEDSLKVSDYNERYNQRIQGNNERSNNQDTQKAEDEQRF